MFLKYVALYYWTYNTCNTPCHLYRYLEIVFKPSKDDTNDGIVVAHCITEMYSRVKMLGPEFRYDFQEP